MCALLIGLGKFLVFYKFLNLAFSSPNIFCDHFGSLILSQLMCFIQIFLWNSLLQKFKIF